MVSQIAATNADCVDFAHFLGDSHQSGHRAERLAQKVRIQACHDDSHAPVGKFLCNFNEIVTEELGLVNANHTNIVINVQHGGGILYRLRGNLMEIV